MPEESYRANALKKDCLHFCEMSDKIEGCCECSDMRTYRQKYFVYVDGRGLVRGPRHAHYCPTCVNTIREHGRLRHAAKETPLIGEVEVAKVVKEKEVEESDLEMSEDSEDSTNDLEDVTASNPKFTIANYKECNHFCDLSPNHKKCCECADTRPHGSVYYIYIDGFGDSHTTSRHEHYCPVCKNRCAKPNHSHVITTRAAMIRSKHNSNNKNKKAPKGPKSKPRPTFQLYSRLYPERTAITTTNKKRSTLPTLNTIEEPKAFDEEVQ